jgi:phosphate transport system ATP-binding protein
VTVNQPANQQAERDDAAVIPRVDDQTAGPYATYPLPERAPFEAPAPTYAYGGGYVHSGASLVGLDARDVSAWFGDHQVLDRVSLLMAGGRVTALIGPSGCGKSTFLRILNRMHELIPSATLAGEVLLDGVDVYDASRRITDARRQIGMVFQKPNPFPTMSVFENVVAGLRLSGVRERAVLHEAAERALRQAALWDEVKDSLSKSGVSLSGGQQQRLCIARALAVEPEVLLMDEPCSALDPIATAKIEELILELRSTLTIVIVTHNMQQAARVSEATGFFLLGDLVEFGVTRQLFTNPRDKRTEDYITGRFG